VRNGACPVHARAREQRRGTATQRGYGARHQRWRKLVLARHPICCASGCGKLATEADHVVALSLGGTWAVENGQGLCKRHHSQKTRREQRDPFAMLAPQGGKGGKSL